VLGKYRRTLQSDRRHLLEQFTLVQVARKVVGVLRPPAAGREVLRADRGDAPGGHDDLRRAVRVDPGPGARPLRGPHRLGAYLGGSDRFDQAIADFAETYADQNELDYAALQAAVKEGKAEATTEIQ
jgi:Uncharacterized protein conserved in bacteria (DUF2252)